LRGVRKLINTFLDTHKLYSQTPTLVSSVGVFFSLKFMNTYLLALILFLLPLLSFGQLLPTHGTFTVSSELNSRENSIRKGDTLDVFSNEPKFSCLSFVSAEIYKDWDNQLVKFKKQYKGESVLLLVSEHESIQQSEFLRTFYKQVASMDHKSAYEASVKLIDNKYNTIDFKHAFFE
jgi:hypothetical protein